MKKRTIALTLAMLTMVSAVGCGKSESGNTAKAETKVHQPGGN